MHINVQFSGLIPPVGKAGGQGKVSLWHLWGQGCGWLLRAPPRPSASPGHAFLQGDEMQPSPPLHWSTSQLRPSTLMMAALPTGWRAVLQPSSSPLSRYEFDVLISAGGGKFVPEGDSSGSRHPCDWYRGLRWGLTPILSRRVQAEGDEGQAGHRHHHQLHQPPQPGRGGGGRDQRRGPNLQPEVLPKPLQQNRSVVPALAWGVLGVCVPSWCNWRAQPWDVL